MYSTGTDIVSVVFAAIIDVDDTITSSADARVGIIVATGSNDALDMVCRTSLLHISLHSNLYLIRHLHHHSN